MATRGRPIVGVRLDKSVITALKDEAVKRKCTMTDIISDLVVEELKRCGHSLVDKPIEGQIRIQD